MSVDGIVEIFSRVLETDDITVDSDFFAAGGDSLIATRVLSAVARHYQVELSFEDFLIDPTPSGVAQRVADAVGTAEVLAR
jgi:acyl carrier protein